MDVTVLSTINYVACALLKREVVDYKRLLNAICRLGKVLFSNLISIKCVRGIRGSRQPNNTQGTAEFCAWIVVVLLF